MDTQRLQGFVTVARLGKISRAAERLNISQPALSRQIQQLEQEFGSQLFVRTGRGVRLTEAGERLAARARPLLRALNGLLEDVQAQQDQLSGSVSVGLPPSFPPAAVTELLQELGQRHPGIRLRLVAGLSGAVHSGLLDGSLDLAVLHAPVVSRQLAIRGLWKEQIRIVSPPEWNLGPALPLAEALQRPVLLPSRRHKLRELLAAWATTRGLQLRVAVEIDSLRLLVSSVQAGIGLTFLPPRTISGEVGSGRLAVTEVSDVPLVREVVLAWSGERLATPTTRAVTEILIEVAQRHASEYRLTE